MYRNVRLLVKAELSEMDIRHILALTVHLYLDHRAVYSELDIRHILTLTVHLYLDHRAV